MKGFTSRSALAVAALTIFIGGCAAPEHRMNVAASRDETRRSEFEHCRDAGRTDCDTILNAPVNSNTPGGTPIRDQERRAAYDRCVDRGGSDCDDLLHR
jgi:PBP1b-binding outer membrane lipoprotein LpoB